MADKLYDMLHGKQKVLKEKLAVDYETYKQTKVSNAVIEDIEPNIQEHLSGLTREENMEYETRQEDYYFRQDLRRDFSRPDGIRQSFLKLYGTMMENGMNLARNPNSASDYEAFRRQMEQMFGEKHQAEIDQALNIIPNGESQAELQEKRAKLYAVKSQEIYFKTMAGILSHKKEFDHSNGVQAYDYMTYVQNIEQKFIRGLQCGKTDVDCLAFVEPDNTAAKSKAEELALRKKYKDDTAENQIVSVHHKLPIGAARDIFRRLLGKKDERTERHGCSALVNNLGNMSLIIGKQTHQMLEAYGNYNITAKSDNMIFASRINTALLEITHIKIPPYLREGIKKYALQSSKSGIITVDMNFSEAPEIAQARKKLKMPHVVTNVVNKFKQIWKNAPAK